MRTSSELHAVRSGTAKEIEVSSLQAGHTAKPFLITGEITNPLQIKDQDSQRQWTPEASSQKQDHKDAPVCRGKSSRHLPRSSLHAGLMML